MWVAKTHTWDSSIVGPIRAFDVDIFTVVTVYVAKYI